MPIQYTEIDMRIKTTSEFRAVFHSPVGVPNSQVPLYLQVSGLIPFRRLTWRPPLRSRSLVTRYQVTYSKGDTEGHEKWVTGDQRSLTFKCSARNDIHKIEVRPYCGQVVKGPGVMLPGKEPGEIRPKGPGEIRPGKEPQMHDYSLVHFSMPLYEEEEEEEEEDLTLPCTPAVPQIEMSVQVLMDGRDSDWQPGGIAVMSDGRLIITDMDNDCLRISTILSTPGL